MLEHVGDSDPHPYNTVVAVKAPPAHWVGIVSSVLDPTGGYLDTVNKPAGLATASLPAEWRIAFGNETAV
jgi:hypothetical protein